MNELDILARIYGTDKRTNDIGQNIYHGYTDIYHSLLKNERYEYKNILEIGVREGWSHFMWRDYFPKAMIYGIDNFSEPSCTIKKEDIECDRIKVIVGEQDDPKLIEKNFKDIVFDLIIDDGSHRSWHQQKSFKYLWNKLKSGGIYIIEDLAVCAMREFREFDDIRSATTAWLDSIIKKNFFSYYMQENEIKDIKAVQLIGELGIIYKL